MMFLPPFDVLCVLSWPNEVYLFCTLVSYQLSQTKLELFLIILSSNDLCVQNFEAHYDIHSLITNPLDKSKRECTVNPFAPRASYGDL